VNPDAPNNLVPCNSFVAMVCLNSTFSIVLTKKQKQRKTEKEREIPATATVVACSWRPDPGFESEEVEEEEKIRFHSLHCNYGAI